MTNTSFSEKLGAGLGLRHGLISPIRTHFFSPLIHNVDFLEIAPENWLNSSDHDADTLAVFRGRFPIVAHGLCLSLGGVSPLNYTFLKQLKHFFKMYDISFYTEHLSYSDDNHLGEVGYLYDLLPIPFTAEAVSYVAKRIREVQDILEQRIAIENVSYYLDSPISELSEIDFLKAVLVEADCNLHLDINNVYVNSVNFNFDPYVFLDNLPWDKVVYGHIAGHRQQSVDLLIDTHGEDVIDPVWHLLDFAYQKKKGGFPTLLERDNNIPPFEILLKEVDKIAGIHQRYR